MRRILLRLIIVTDIVHDLVMWRDVGVHDLKCLRVFHYGQMLLKRRLTFATIAIGQHQSIGDLRVVAAIFFTDVSHQLVKYEIVKTNNLLFEAAIVEVNSTSPTVADFFLITQLREVFEYAKFAVD